MVKCSCHQVIEEPDAEKPHVRMEALGCKTVADLQKVDVEKSVKTASALLGLCVWAERDGNIHAEKEAERQIVDWEKAYFLTKYYCI